MDEDNRGQNLQLTYGSLALDDSEYISQTGTTIK